MIHKLIINFPTSLQCYNPRIEIYNGLLNHSVSKIFKLTGRIYSPINDHNIPLPFQRRNAKLHISLTLLYTQKYYADAPAYNIIINGRNYKTFTRTAVDSTLMHASNLAFIVCRGGGYLILLYFNAKKYYSENFSF